MSRKEENIATARAQAESKLTALRSNQKQLQEKLLRIEEQKKANEEKIRKIEYFLRNLSNGT